MIRGRPGNFDEVIQGIDRLRALTAAKVTLVTTISTLNPGAMERTAQLAKDLGVGIAFNSIEPTLDFGLTDSDQSPNLKFQLTPEQLHQFYVTALRLKREGYPLMETEEVLEGYVADRPWKCEFPKMFVYVTPDKKIYSCDYRLGYDLKTGSFEEYFSSEMFRSHASGAPKRATDACATTRIPTSYAPDTSCTLLRTRPDSIAQGLRQCRDVPRGSARRAESARLLRVRRAGPMRTVRPGPSGSTRTRGHRCSRASSRNPAP